MGMSKRTQNQINAIKHEEQQEAWHREMIQRSIDYSWFYFARERIHKHTSFSHTEIVVSDVDAHEEIVKHFIPGSGYIIRSDSEHAVLYNPRVGVLNPISFKHSGEGFYRGDMGPEERLYHASNLHNILNISETCSDDLRFALFYKFYKGNTNNGLYEDSGIMSPYVLFNDCAAVNVFSCAAPNKKDAIEKYGLSDNDNYQALDSRIEFILDSFSNYGCSDILLGPFGCETCGQDAREVAEIFREKLMTTHEHTFSRVTFAVPKSSSNESHEAFVHVFGNHSII